jgi:hypothetical protein
MDSGCDPVNDIHITGVPPLVVHVAGGGGAGGVRWRGAHPDAAGPYTAGDLVRDGAWLMIATRNTEQRPTPLSTGLPVWMMEDAAPDSYDTGAHSVLCGVRVNVDHRFAVVVKGVRVWIADPGMRHTLWLVPNSTTVPEWARVDFTPTSAGWVEVPVDSATFLPGMVFDALVEVTATDHAVQQTIVWNFQHVTAGVQPPAPGEIMMTPKQPDLMLISDRDASLADRGDLVRGLRPGDTITARDVTYTIVDSTRGQGEPFQRVHVAPAGVVSGIDRPSTPFNVVGHSGPVSATVGQVGGHWVAPWIDDAITGSGLYSTTGRAGLRDDVHGWGVDLLIRKVTIPDDWQIVTTAANALPAEPVQLAEVRDLVDAAASASDFADFRTRITRKGVSR